MDPLEAKRSAVRRNVTYMLVIAFILFSGFMLWVLTQGAKPNIEAALAIVAGTGSFVGLAVGFYFGGRAAEKANRDVQP